MTTFPLVKGTRLRATKVDSCGKPVAGPRNRLVTAGFVSLGLTAVMREAADLTQDNAEGKECVTDRTAPERRWYTPALELCNVNPGLITMFTGWENVLDANDEVIGFRDQKEIESDYGIALEVWTSGKSEDDCAEAPATDEILLETGSGRKYGYFLFAGTEWTLGDINIGATVATLTLTGRTISTTFASGASSSLMLGSSAAASIADIPFLASAAALLALTNWVRLRVCSRACWVSPKATLSRHSASQMVWPCRVVTITASCRRWGSNLATTFCPAYWARSGW